MKYQIINGAITFGNNTILEEINFTINKSDRIAIVGVMVVAKLLF